MLLETVTHCSQRQKAFAIPAVRGHFQQQTQSEMVRKLPGQDGSCASIILWRRRPVTPATWVCQSVQVSDRAVQQTQCEMVRDSCQARLAAARPSSSGGTGATRVRSRLRGLLGTSAADGGSTGFSACTDKAEPVLAPSSRGAQGASAVAHLAGGKHEVERAGKLLAPVLRCLWLCRRGLCSAARLCCTAFRLCLCSLC